VIEYFYDARTKKFLGHNREDALARVEGNSSAPIKPDSVAGLIERYKASPRFKKLKPGTQELYNRSLNHIKQGWGHLAASGVRPSTIERIKEEFQNQPGKCHMTLAMFRILLGLAVRLEYVPLNVASKPGHIAAPARKAVWTHEHEQRFLAVASASIQLSFMLLLYTLQRPSDVLGMSVDRLSERNGRMFIAVQQAKTGALIDVPVHETLRAMLMMRVSVAQPGDPLIADPRGLQWRYRSFARCWDKAMALVGIQDLQRRDLRRTGIVRMAEAGCPTPTIAAVSGHSIDWCQRIIDTYLPRRTEVALKGIEIWEKANTAGYSPVVQLAIGKAICAPEKQRPLVARPSATD
jgi:hypothetical protein